MSDTARNVVHIARYPNGRSSTTHTRDKSFISPYRQKSFFTELFITITTIVVGLFLVTSPAHAFLIGDESGQLQNSGNTLLRRADTIDPSATSSCYVNIYCQPAYNANITTSSFTVKWNTYENKLSTVGAVDIYLSPASNPYSNKIILGSLDSPQGSLGQIQVSVKPNYFSQKGKPNETISESMYLWVLPRREVPSANQAYLPITLSMVMPSESTPTPVSTVIIKETSSAMSNNDPHSTLSTGAIIGISVGGGLLLIIIIGGIFIWAIYKRRNAAATAAAAKSANNNNNIIINNSNSASGGSDVAEAGVAAGPLGSSDTLNAPVSPGNLSAGDAILIAATYRQLMRKPSWKVSAGEGVDEEEEEDDDDDGGALGPMLHRRKTGARVLMEELANEGHGLHNVNAGTAVCIDDSASAVTEPARHSAASTITPLVTSLSPPGSPKSLTR
ncbi:hypothetical protein BDF22DRAFT_372405 [Syncephalis plumigaleata]|nr:hypothetical protein BDF22DRAFT_372405 [Syncephalis plumigaleata]